MINSENGYGQCQIYLDKKNNRGKITMPSIKGIKGKIKMPSLKNLKSKIRMQD